MSVASLLRGASISLLCVVCSAQEAINTPAATQASTGRAVVREQLRYYHADGFPAGSGLDSVDELRFDTSVQIGLRHDLSLLVEQPASLLWSDLAGGGSQSDEDFGDLRVTGKWRFHRNDTGPIDTERASVIAGMQFDTGGGASLRPGFERDGNDPIAGLVYTRVSGRHGGNAAIVGTFSTSGREDEIDYGVNYLYRVSPAEYGAETTGAAYAVLELNGFYETNGDHELLVSPGFMYEAQRWTLELSVQLPLVQELDHRPEIDVGVVLGYRILL